MSGLPSTGYGWLDGFLAILLLLLGSGFLGQVLSKKFRPAVTMPELLTDVQEERNTLSARVTRLEDEARARDNLDRVRDDYIYELREHIAERKAPPPPAWPEELRRK